MKEGDWVVAVGGSKGPGKIQRVNQLGAVVRIGATPKNPATFEKPVSELRRFAPTEGQVMWVPVTVDGCTVWAQGEFLAGVGDRWFLKVPSVGAEPVLVDPGDVWMKPFGERPSAIDMLAEVMPGAKGEQGPRRRFRRWLVEQQACTGGYSAFVSSPVRPVPHQLNAVARVLGDPVRRFLLADEVGLGKTIEAGLIIRQILQDDRKAIASVVVPESLVDQWLRELNDKVRLGVLMKRCSVTSFGGVDAVNDSTLLVIDEAHRPCDDAHLDHRHYATLTRLAHHAADLLLLSATPLRGSSSTLLRMMHLIDPGGYPLVDFDQFAVRLNARASQAQLLSVLRSETSPEVVDELLDELTGLLPPDHGLEDLLNGVRHAVSEAARADVVNDLVVEVQERFRIGRRLIRTSKASVRREHYPIPGRDLLVEEVQGLGGEFVDEFVQRWIGLAQGHGGVTVGQVTEVLTAGLGGALTLLDWVAHREMDLQSGASPIFPAESALIHEFVLRLSDTSRCVDALLSHFERMFASEGPPVVVAVTRTNVARQLLSRLQDRFGPNRVRAYLASMNFTERRESLEALHGANPPRVFVIDESAEEGCNLQVARSIINVDLPWDVNRLEQRLGRLDRYSPGASIAAHAIVLVDRDCGLQRKNLRFLEAIGVFRESVTGVQRGLSAVLSHMASAVLQKGVDALLDRHEEIASQLAEDRRDTELLEYLESATAFGEFPKEFGERLITLDEEWGQGQKAINGLTNREGGYNIRRRDFVEGGQVFVYQCKENTSVQGSLREWLTRAVGNPVTSSRPLALQRPNVELLRIGHDFVDILGLCVDFDERGRVEIRWWHEPSAIEERKRFDVEVRVDWKVDPKSVPPEIVRTAQRRLSMALPNRIVDLFVDHAGRVIDPVDDWFASGQGERLHGDRAAKAVLQIGNWQAMVDDVKDGVVAEVRRRLAPEIEQATVALAAESDRRQRVLAAAEPTSLPDEQKLAQLMLRSAHKPRIIIESVHVQVKSPIRV